MAISTAFSVFIDNIYGAFEDFQGKHEEFMS